MKRLCEIKFSILRTTDFDKILRCAAELKYVNVLHVDLLPCAYKQALLDIEKFPKSMLNVRKVIVRPLIKDHSHSYRYLSYTGSNYEVKVLPSVNFGKIRTFPLPRSPGTRVNILNHC